VAFAQVLLKNTSLLKLVLRCEFSVFPSNMSKHVSVGQLFKQSLYSV